MSDDGIFDDDDVVEKTTLSNQQNQSQTQPDVKNLISDIFGDSDDEEEQKTRELPAKPANYDDDDDNMFADSDDEEGAKFTGRLQKKSTTKVSAPSKPAGDSLLDSDDEDVRKAVQLAKKRKHEDKTKKRLKKKTHMLEPSSKKSRPSTSTSSVSPSKKSALDTPDADGGVSSGDEYDSGEDAPETAEDRAFIDKDDDHADLLDEYNADNQRFDDERPGMWCLECSLSAKNVKSFVFVSVDSTDF